MILIALGSNLGNREDYLVQARTVLEMFDVSIRRESSILETPALMPEGAPADWNIPYLNQVLRVDTHLAPLDLLSCLKHIEADLGRKLASRWAPREIDMDILAYNDVVMVEDVLTLPHPHMESRRFVLMPLAEIAPLWLHPIYGKTAAEMLAELLA